MVKEKEEEGTHAQPLLDALKTLLFERNAATQEDICAALEAQGFDINQSKASRLLRKVGAIKVINASGHTVYSLAREPSPPSMNSPLKDLIVSISHNEVMVVIFTSPGSASMVARILDYYQIKTEILGTIAGDDTIFVVPKTIVEIEKLASEIKGLLKN